MYPQHCQHLPHRADFNLRRAREAYQMLYKFNKNKLRELANRFRTYGLLFKIFEINEKEKLLNSSATYVKNMEDYKMGFDKLRGVLSCVDVKNKKKLKFIHSQ
jgi:hypothetical protein